MVIKWKCFNRMDIHSSFIKRRVARVIDAILFISGVLFLSTVLEIIRL